MLLKEIRKIYHKELDPIFPGEEVDSFFYMLTEHYLELERFALVLNPEINISREEEQPLFEALAQLKLEKPIQYIIGETTFMDLTFKVNEEVLIPRPETEELLRWVISDYSEHRLPKNHKLQILDIGTGSGCIAVSLAKYIKNAQVFALDYSNQILDIAATNAAANKVAVSFIEADIFKIETLESKFDVIVSNPPYVRLSEMNQMQRNVVEYEPAAALFVADEDPLVFYEKIARLAIKSLNTGGALFLEINQYLGDQTAAVLECNGFNEIETRKDLFGNVRMLKGVSGKIEK